MDCKITTHSFGHKIFMQCLRTNLKRCFPRQNNNGQNKSDQLFTVDRLGFSRYLFFKLKIHLLNDCLTQIMT